MRNYKQCLNLAQKVNKLANLQLAKKSEMIYTFDQSFCKFGLKFKNFDNLQIPDMEEYIKYGINRYFYDISDPKETEKLLKEQTTDSVKYLMETQKLAGCIYHLPYMVHKDQFLKDKQVQAFMHCIAQFYKMQVGESEQSGRRKFRIYTGIDGQMIQDSQFFEEIIGNVFENYKSIQSIIMNTFDIEMVFLSRSKNPWGNLWQRDHFLDIFEKKKLAIDLNLIKTMPVQEDKKAMMKELLMFIYDNSEQMNAIFVKDYKNLEDKNFKKCQLGEGMMSFTHLTDIFKLNTFEGYVIFDQKQQDETIKNIQFFQNLLEEQGFSKTEVETYEKKQQKKKQNVGEVLDV